MTMRNPLGGEYEMIRPAFDPLKNYKYTWPGQQPVIVSGKELEVICAGADPTSLSIEVVTDATRIPVPSTSRKDGDR